MTIPTVRDWGASEVVTEAKLDEISAALNFLLAPPRCKVYRTSDTTVTGTFTAISWNAESYDSSSMHDTGTNPTRLIAPESGLYEIKAVGRFGAESDGIPRLDVRKNAAGVYPDGEDVLLLSGIRGEGNIGYVGGSVEKQLLANDYLELFLLHTTTAPPATVSAGEAETFLSMRFTAKTV